MFFDEVPESVRTPVDAFQEPVMPLPFVNARTSSADWKPEEIVTVADSKLVSSESVLERLESMTEAPSFSEKARVPLAADKTGTSLTAEMDVERVKAVDEMAELAPLELASTVRPLIAA